MGSTNNIRLLVVEDDEVDRLACRRALAQHPVYSFTILEAETAREGLHLALTEHPDCVLLDYRLPDLDGLEFLVELAAADAAAIAPVLMLTGTTDIGVAVEAMRRGARDYLIKDTERRYLELLPAVIERVLREQRTVTEKRVAENRLREAEEKYRTLVEQIPAITYVASLEEPARLMYVSPQVRQLGFTPQEWIGEADNISSHIHPDDRERALGEYAAARRNGATLRSEYRLLTRDGEARWFLDEAQLVRDAEGTPLFLQGVLVDISEDKRLEDELRYHQRRLEELVASRTEQLNKRTDLLTAANANLTRALEERQRMEAALRDSHADLNRAQAVARTGSWRLDIPRNELRWSDETYRIFGIPRGTSMTYETFLAGIHPDDREYVDRKWKAALGGEPFDIEHRIIADGELKWVRERAKLEFDSAGSPLGGIGTVQDITERRRAEQALRASEARYRHLIENMADGYALQEVLLDEKGEPFDYRYLEVNPAFERILGLKLEQVVGKTVLEVVPDTESYWLDTFRKVAVTGQPARLEHYGQSFGRYFEITASRPEPGLVAAFFADVTERRRAEEALRQSEARFRQLLESAGDGIVGLDAAGRCTFVNQAALDLLGYADREMLGKSAHALFHHSRVDGSPYPEAACAVCHAFRAGRSSHAVTEPYWRRDGSSFPAEYSAFPIRENGNVTGAVIVFRDATEVQALTRRLSYQAAHDALTGLVNRQEFERRLERALAEAHEHDSTHALCYLDLDQFKVVNDTCGHGAGDELLRALGARLQEKVRGRDTLARLGGDEFGVLLEHCAPDHALRVATDLLDTVREFRFAWDDRVFQVGVSIGLVPVTSQTDSAAAALSIADSACYAAKEQGRNRVHVYHPGDAALLERHAEMGWVSRLTRALDENRFCLYYQQIVPLAPTTSTRHHCEILLRLRAEDGSLVVPGLFLPAAGRYNLMPAIDRWVIRHAIATYARRERPVRGADAALYAINVSAATLADEDFPQLVRTELAQHGVPGTALCFEISESAALANPGRTARLVQELKSAGCLVALDNFGRGLSSFGDLRTLAVDFIKIDATFVHGLDGDRLNHAVAEAINKVAHVMFARTIAEGVENARAMTALRELGIDHAQGYAIMTPQPLDDGLDPQQRSPAAARSGGQ